MTNTKNVVSINGGKVHTLRVEGTDKYGFQIVAPGCLVNPGTDLGHRTKSHYQKTSGEVTCSKCLKK